MSDGLKRSFQTGDDPLFPLLTIWTAVLTPSQVISLRLGHTGEKGIVLRGGTLATKRCLNLQECPSGL
jgi:hypothetical protein